MDPALLLLWRLRFKAWFRRWGKTLRKPKGILLTLVGLLVFVPWILSIAYTPRQAMPFDPEKVRRFGPLALLVFSALTLALSSGERVLLFQPAEIDFLFPGPFTRRGLLAYKVAGAVFGVMFSSLFLLLAFLRSSRSPVSAYLAIVTTMLFLQFLGMAAGLASNTVAAFATSVRRRAVVAAVIALAIATAWSAGAEVLSLPPREAVERVESSPVLRAATAPFRPFINAYTARGLWPEAAGWLAACLGMVAAMLGIVFAIDAQYFETSAASSARIYAQIARMRQGGGLMPGRSLATKPKTARWRLAMLPWWGGVGPVLWRQLSTALREPVRLAILTLILVGPGAAPLFGRGGGPGGTSVAQLSTYTFAGIAVYLSAIFSAMVAFDFRGDVDRMEELKALPIAALPLVIGQLTTPVLVFALPGWVGFAAIASALGGAAAADFAFLAMVAPMAALMVGIDNLLFLLFPTRATQASTADFASMGRQVLLILAKFLLGGLTIAAAVLVGFLVHSFGGSRLAVNLGALAVMTLAAGSLIPLLAMAFRRYDVASDTPA